jgi:GntR family transcriptional repressor for pyruvate dehydrogenase complex
VAWDRRGRLTWLDPRAAYHQLSTQRPLTTAATARAPAALFAPVRTRQTLEDVVHQLADAIRSGGVGEGEMLPSERALAERMQVSRPTVRAAIELLVEAGVVAVRAGRHGGPQVVSIWVPPALTGTLPPSRSGDELFRLLEARRVLEPRIAQLAALRGTDAHFERMERSIEMLERNRDDHARYEQAHDLFHRVMWQAAENTALEAALVAVFRQLAVERDSMLRTAADIGAGAELHRATLQALRRGGPEEVEAEMHRHLAHFELLIEDVVGRGITARLPAVVTGPERPYP